MVCVHMCVGVSACACASVCVRVCSCVCAQIPEEGIRSLGTEVAWILLDWLADQQTPGTLLNHPTTQNWSYGCHTQLSQECYA